MSLTIRTEEFGVRVVRKDDVAVADIIVAAGGKGLSVHYFGPTKFLAGKWPKLVDDMLEARELIKTAATQA